MNIKFNKYINRIGIEFEGCFTGELLDHIEEHDTLEVGDDVSVHSDWVHHRAKEVRTVPLTAAPLNKVFDFFAAAEESKDYRINDSVGLHYHISFKKEYYYYLLNTDFYAAYDDMFKELCPTVYAKRYRNSYAAREPKYAKGGVTTRLEDVIQKKSRTKY